mmetsp:Transcript_4489/g.14910  ORF Transcript_4489/g.14910 Transcript_4489/m.14910 type:complete len:242 (+) Transcript_4489:1992-2717(+)
MDRGREGRQGDVGDPVGLGLRRSWRGLPEPYAPRLPRGTQRGRRGVQGRSFPLRRELRGLLRRDLRPRHRRPPQRQHHAPPLGVPLPHRLWPRPRQLQENQGDQRQARAHEPRPHAGDDVRHQPRQARPDERRLRRPLQAPRRSPQQGQRQRLPPPHAPPPARPREPPRNQRHLHPLAPERPPQQRHRQRTHRRPQRQVPPHRQLHPQQNPPRWLLLEQLRGRRRTEETRRGGPGAVEQRE